VSRDNEPYPGSYRKGYVFAVVTERWLDPNCTCSVRCSDLMKTLYERSGRGRAHAQVLGMDDTINLTAFEV
jgi:hypothetical protein